jgi:hypothetical protein
VAGSGFWIHPSAKATLRRGNAIALRMFSS